LSVWSIVLNPVIGYAWHDHRSIMGRTEYAWQDVGTVPMHFGKRKASEWPSTLHARDMDFNGVVARGGKGLILDAEKPPAVVHHGRAGTMCEI
jgi:hypothetical protein